MKKLNISFSFYQKTRLDHLNSLGHHPGDELDKCVGSSAATTVVRKTIHPIIPMGKPLQRSSNSSEGTSRSNPIEQNHKVLANRHALEQLQHRASMRQSASKTEQNPFHNTYTGQQLLLTSGDIEAMTLKQFRMGSLGC
jgi:hypothetical protein